MKKQIFNLGFLLAIILIASPVLAEEMVGTSAIKNEDNPVRIELRGEVEGVREDALKEQERIREEAKQKQKLLREGVKNEQEVLREDAKNEQEVLKTKAEALREEAKTRLAADITNGDNIRQVRTEVKADMNTGREDLKNESGRVREELKTRAEKIRKEAKQQSKRNREELKNQIEENYSQAILALQKVLELANGSSTAALRMQNAAQIQAKNQEKIATNIERIQTQSKVARFFFGPKVYDIEEVKNTIEDNQTQIETLEEVKADIESDDDIKVLDEQIKVLKDNNIKTTASVENAQNSFSLFGWVNRFFRR